MHVYVIDQDSGECSDLVVAARPADALAVMVEQCGVEYFDEAEEVTVTRLVPDRVQTIRNDDEPADPETMTCGEWAAKGRGMLASTEW